MLVRNKGSKIAATATVLTTQPAHPACKGIPDVRRKIKYDFPLLLTINLNGSHKTYWHEISRTTTVLYHSTRSSVQDFETIRPPTQLQYSPTLFYYTVSAVSTLIPITSSCYSFFRRKAWSTCRGQYASYACCNHCLQKAHCQEVCYVWWRDDTLCSIRKNLIPVPEKISTFYVSRLYATAKSRSTICMRREWPRQTNYR